jgi:8-oxo-dGTP pyrophosphatase MutT (NUDIX family)
MFEFADLLKHANSFEELVEGNDYTCLKYGAETVGFLMRNVMDEVKKVLQIYPNLCRTFKIADNLEVFPTEDSQDLSSQFALLIEKLKNAEDDTFCSVVLKKHWRNEQYPVFSSKGLIFTMERAAASLFGVRHFGCHLNGYVVSNSKLMMWVATRSPQKQTFPGYLDNIVGGGLPYSLTPLENILKEAEEEASLPSSVLKQCVKPVGLVSLIMHKKDRGIVPDTEYVFDAHLPDDFIPKPNDNEVERFDLWPLDKVLSHIHKFTPESGLVVIDFCIRQGHLTPDNLKNYEMVCCKLRNPLCDLPGPESFASRE